MNWRRSTSERKPGCWGSRPRGRNCLMLCTLGKAIDRYETMRRAKGGKGIKSLDAALRTVRSNLGKHLNLPVREFGKSRPAQHPRRYPQTCAAAGQPLPGLLRADLALVRTGGHRRLQFRARRDEDRPHPEAQAGYSTTTRSPRSGGRPSSWTRVPRALFGAMVRFLLLTAQRRGEAAALRHGNIFDGIWRQKREDNKASRRIV